MMNLHSDQENDPYHVLPSVIFLDEKIQLLDSRIKKLAEGLTENHGRTALQDASLQLIPATSSLAKSIRELIREGYLLSALVLFRPLMERVATLSYLVRNEEAIALWEAGWPHGRRPSLRERLTTLMPGATDEIFSSFTAAVTKYNSLIHGDPDAAQQSMIELSGHGGSYTLDRDYVTPGRAGGIALETAISVVFLIVLIDDIFPQ
ncbi:DUF5677 domain-containing protein [Nonomuraea fuscirosea]|uniref:DUF5677 domain-containing protein n=1 Tax=Nonomuraea fuscirosea TaxID=1291556 RepID=UPI0033CCFAC4